MREILFRGKRQENDVYGKVGEWVYGIPIQNKIGTFISFDKNPHYCYQDYYIELDEISKIDPETVGQYTGMTDIRGNRIFEGDIVNCTYDGKLRTYVVVWDKDELDFKATNGKEQYRNNFVYLPCCDEIEIIQNIHDIPDLLNGGE